LLEIIIEKGNLNAAYPQVKKNEGSHGVDKMKVESLLPFLKQHGETIRQSVVGRTYKLQPVPRV
jgi:retron-type reverse transcriptase